MWLLVALAVALIIAAFLIIQIRQRRTLPNDTYICDICGESHCTCRKEKKD